MWSATLEKRMDEIKNKKQQFRDNTTKQFKSLTKNALNKITRALEDRLFQFANFLESKIVLLYIDSANEVPTKSIMKKTYEHGKIVVLPVFNKANLKATLMKVSNPTTDLTKGPRGILQPRLSVCKAVPIECIDIAIIPAISMDEKGGRIGSGEGYYDQIIPKLPITTRKVGLIFEDQIAPTVPMEAHDKHVDIIITEKRVIYKI